MNFMIAEKKVLTNPDLIKLILDFLEKDIQITCAVCVKTLQYQIFYQIISFEKQSYLNLETCEKKYLCSDECLKEYQRQFNNRRFCLLFNLIFIIIGLLICIVILI